MTRLTPILLAALVATACSASCQRPGPSPTPVATGGTMPAPNGGSAGQAPGPQGGAGGVAQGGKGGQSSAFDRCVAAKLIDPVTRNVATQSGVQLNRLATDTCSDPLVLRGYR